ncbi:TAP-like protein-domain-containing protein [Apodospora peruviana]|uniref:TAP-like protein-domain-containing protein n=1 Tax=Apodospora peruviana TaxID=516989 RepID=A0AAE0HZ28_9PEZI|nr:TAP-like protein-domain-containing protein [Apodospora peruviana]
MPAMTVFITFINLLALAPAVLGSPLHTLTNSSQQIKWGPCDFQSVSPLPVECGTLLVPVDYTNTACNETVALSLLRSRAVKAPSKGSILFNFGGPGYGAIHTLDLMTASFHGLTGGQYDLIAFDPRGVEKTLTFSCFDTPVDRKIAGYKYPLLPLNASDVALVDTWANTQALSNICRNRNTTTDRGALVGTAFVARDMMQIVDALGEDGLLRFWGISYGSLLGATVAAMFPDRMDRLVLDGVVNGHNYYHRFDIDVDSLLSADAAFRAILSECIAVGPAKCALATVNSTASELEATLIQLIEDFKANPIAVNTTIINAMFVVQLYYIVIKYPSAIANAAVHINYLLHRRNLTAVVDYYNGLQAGIAMGDDDSLWGIKCGDTIPRATELADVRPEVEHMAKSSEIFGSYLTTLATQCAPWPFEAKERYLGDFKVKTKVPVLFVGNTYDPVTPVASARNMSASFEGSVVLEQRGFGHASTSQSSACTAKVLRAYFANGTLPEAGTVCEVDTPLFKSR